MTNLNNMHYLYWQIPSKVSLFLALFDLPKFDNSMIQWALLNYLNSENDTLLKFAKTYHRCSLILAYIIVIVWVGTRTSLLVVLVWVGTCSPKKCYLTSDIQTPAEKEFGPPKTHLKHLLRRYLDV